MHDAAKEGTVLLNCCWGPWPVGRTAPNHDASDDTELCFLLESASGFATMQSAGAASMRYVRLS